MSCDDSWIEEEIQKELDQLDSDTDSTEAEITSQDVSEKSLQFAIEVCLKGVLAFLILVTLFNYVHSSLLWIYYWLILQQIFFLFCVVLFCVL